MTCSVVEGAGSEGGDLPPEAEVVSIGELIKSQRKLAERRRKERRAQEPPEAIRKEDPMDVLSEIENDIGSFGPIQVKDALCRLKEAACALGQGQVDVYGILSLLIDKRLKQLIDKATEGLTSMTSKDMVEAVDAVASLGYYPEHDQGAFSRKALGEIHRRLKEDQVGEDPVLAAGLLASLNRVGYQPEEDQEALLVSLLGVVEGQLDKCSTETLVIVVRGLGEMALEASEQQDARFQEVLSSAEANQSFDGADLFPPLYSPKVAPFLSDLTTELARRMDTLTIADLHVIIAGLSILRFRPSPYFFQAFVAAFMETMSQCDPPVLGATLRALVLTSRLAGQPLYRRLLVRAQETVRAKMGLATLGEQEAMQQGLGALKDAVVRHEKATLTFLMLVTKT